MPILNISEVANNNFLKGVSMKNPEKKINKMPMPFSQDK